MAPFKTKLEKGMQKMQGILKPSKRRISEESELPTQQMKQPRTTAKSKSAPSRIPKAIPIHSGPFQTPTPPSTSASESMTDYRLDGADGPSGVGSSYNPINIPQKIRNAPDSTTKNPIDLTFDDELASIPRLESNAWPEPQWVDYVQAQIDNDAAIALALQQDFENELEGPAQGLSSGPPSTGGSENINDVSELERWRQELQVFSCGSPQCRRSMPVTAQDLVAQTKKRLKERYLHPCMRCSKCKMWSCFGGDVYAGANVPALKHVATVGGKQTCKVTWCCDKARSFLIFSLLCGFQASGRTPGSIQTGKGKAAISASSPPKPPSAPELPPPPKPSILGPKTSAFSKGTGYGNHCKIADKPTSIGALTTQSDIDEASRYFFALGCVIPDPNKQNPDAFDNSMHPGLAAMLLRSNMLDIAIQILRSVTVEEMNTWSDVISAVLDFMSRIANHWSLNPVLFCDQVFFPKAEQLLAFTLSPPTVNNVGQDNEPHETGQSAYAVLEEIAVSCQVFIEGTSKLVTKDSGLTGDEAPLATQIWDLAIGLQAYRDQMGGYLESVMKPIPKPTVGTPQVSTPNVLTRSRSAKGKQAQIASINQNALLEMAKFHREHRAYEVPEEAFKLDYYFAKSAKSEMSAAGRMRKLFAQISSLHTDLPDGIYARYAESRPDMIKFIIIGPKNTPYEHGIFEFDMWCPNDYPKTPPQVQFKTTGSGKVRFNPNLYNEGKVCLSLLGTWSTTSWDPAHSTILQVLVSIQSMILVEHPYYNEPGFEYRPDNAQSESYNRNIEYETLRVAILPWLTTNQMSTSIWGEVVRKHFQLKSQMILDTAKAWAGKPQQRVSSLVIPLEQGLTGFAKAV